MKIIVSVSSMLKSKLARDLDWGRTLCRERPVCEPSERRPVRPGR